MATQSVFVLANVLSIRDKFCYPCCTRCRKKVHTRENEMMWVCCRLNTFFLLILIGKISAQPRTTLCIQFLDRETMTKTIHCHWENRFVLAVRKFYQGEFSRSSVGQFWCILLYVWGSSERVCLQICHCIGYGKSVMSPQHGVKLISSVRVIVLTLVKQCGSEIRTF